MKCQSLFSGKNKKNIPKCSMLKFLPSMQNLKCPGGFAFAKKKNEVKLQKFHKVMHIHFMIWIQAFILDLKFSCYYKV